MLHFGTKYIYFLTVTIKTFTTEPLNLTSFYYRILRFFTISSNANIENNL
jgi:hypothetical protein